MRKTATLALTVFVAAACAGAQSLNPEVTRAASANEAVPRLIKHSGALKDRLGKTLTGVQGITFFIYKDQEGGTPLWSETQNVRVESEGSYSAMLGSSEAKGLPLELFLPGETRWLSTRVMLPGEEESARVLLVSVPFALKASDADTLGGQPITAFVLRDSLRESIREALGGPATSTSPANSSGSGDKKPAVTRPRPATQTANRIPLFLSDLTLGDSSLYESSGNVGVGTTTPAGKLDVSGGTALFRNPLNSAAYFQFGGIHSDGRQQLIHYSDSGSIQILASRGGYGGCTVFGGGTAISFCGISGNFGTYNGSLALGGFIVGGIPNAGTHKSLLIGTPNSAAGSYFGGGSVVDLGTASFASNTWSGTRPGIRYTGLSHEFRVDNGTGQNNPGTTALLVDGNGKVGIGTASPTSPLTVTGNIQLTDSGNGVVFSDGTSISTAPPLGSMTTYTVTRTLGCTAGDYVNLWTMSLPVGARILLKLSATGASSAGTAKVFTLVFNYDDSDSTSGGWRELLPLTQTVSRTSTEGDYAIDFQTSNYPRALRLRRTVACSGSQSITVTVQNFDNQALASDSSSGTGATSAGIYRGTPLTQVGGKVGIGTASPTSPLTVKGNIQLTDSGNGVVFSDGTSITTAPPLGNAAANTVTRTLGCTAGDYVTLWTTGLPLGSRMLLNLYSSHALGGGNAKKFTFVFNYDDANATSGGWRELLPFSQAVPRSADGDYAIDYQTYYNPRTFRLRRTVACSGSQSITVTVESFDGQTLTSDSSSGTGATSAGTYRGNSITQIGGNVGIGIAAPVATLQVVDTGGVGVAFDSGNGTYLRNLAGSSAILAQSSTTLGKIGTLTNQDLALTSNNAEVLRATTAGKVGIGTSSPDEKLTVTGNVKLTGTSNGVIFPDGTKQMSACGAVGFSAPLSLRLGDIRVQSDGKTCSATLDTNTLQLLVDAVAKHDEKIKAMEEELAALKRFVEGLRRTQ